MNEKKVCPYCGRQVNSDARFCTYCGHQLRPANDALRQGTEKMSDMIGESIGVSGKSYFNIKDLFTEVFKKHGVDDEDEIFIAGTSSTTPDLKDVITNWPKPWAYSRVFLVLFLTTALLYIMVNNFNNSNMLPGFIFMAALTMPFTVLIFFWEANAPRNISFFMVLRVFLIGGAMALLSALILYMFDHSRSETTLAYALIIGLIEEVAKLIVSAAFIHRRKYPFILNGLLIGAAVGAGFAVFETSGYIFNYFLYYLSKANSYGYSASLQYAVSQSLSVAVLRGWTSLGGHVVWSAMTCAGFVAAMGETKSLSDAAFHKRTLTFLLLAIILHALWDFNIEFLGAVKYILLIVVAWFIILNLISAGLRQIQQLTHK